MDSSFDLQTIQSTLAIHRVAVSIGGNVLRSPNVYNDVSDIAALASVLTRQAKILG